MNALDVIEGLLEYVDEWTFEDLGAERCHCRGCGVNYAASAPNKEHASGCRLKVLLEESRAMAEKLRDLVDLKKSIVPEPAPARTRVSKEEP